VAFHAVDKAAVLAKFGVADVNGPVSLVIWTTTPWTLPANRAISLSPEFDYALVQVDGQALILAKDLVESVMKRAARRLHHPGGGERRRAGTDAL
jgi:isoleucyl-tRNA synthetase